MHATELGHATLTTSASTNLLHAAERLGVEDCVLP